MHISTSTLLTAFALFASTLAIPTPTLTDGTEGLIDSVSALDVNTLNSANEARKTAGDIAFNAGNQGNEAVKTAGGIAYNAGAQAGQDLGTASGTI